MIPKVVATVAKAVDRARLAWLSKRESVESRCTEIALAGAIAAIPGVDTAILLCHGSVTLRKGAGPEPHSWLRCEGFIIDGTLDQFGGRPGVWIQQEVDPEGHQYEERFYLTIRPYHLLPLLQDMGLHFLNIGCELRAVRETRPGQAPTEVGGSEPRDSLLLALTQVPNVPTPSPRLQSGAFFARCNTGSHHASAFLCART